MPETTVTSYDDLQKEIKAAEDAKCSKIFVLFTGSPDPTTGESWCPDCKSADPVIHDFFASQDDNSYILIRCLVGDRPTWKDLSNNYRKKMQISAVPTLVYWKKNAKLVEEELLDKEKLSMMFDYQRC